MKGHTAPGKPAPMTKNKQVADNEKRLMAIKENMKLKQAQQSISLTALKDVDSKSHSQRIVFKYDSSDDDDDETCKDKKKLTLFDSEDEDENIDDIFKSKPHLEGKKGAKLMRLEQRIADPRFKLDARFALSSDSEEGEGDYEERNKPLTEIGRTLEEEKIANLKVLENIVGKTTLARFSEKLKRNVKHITDMNKLRFDPNKIQTSETVSVDKKKPSQGDKTASSNEKAADIKTNAVKKMTDDVKKMSDDVKKPADDVKKPTVNMAPSLVNLFRKEETESFSLLKHFDQQTDDEEMESEDSNDMGGVGSKSPGPLSALFKDQARKADLGRDKTPSKSESTHSEGVGSSLVKHQTKKVDSGHDKVKTSKSGSVHSEEEMESSSSSAEDMNSDNELLEKDDRLHVAADEDKIDEDLINAGRVDIRFTKERWLERWAEIRPVLVTLYKRKHKEAMKNKRRQEEFTRKKEFLKRSRKNRFRK